MGKLEGKVAVITGANSGIGLATAHRFAAEGAVLFLMARRQAELDKAVHAVGNGARGFCGDISDLADIEAFYDVVQRESTAIDILFANAGGGSFAPLTEVTEEHYAKTFDTNVKGTLFTVQKALPLFRDGGSIILTGSTAGSKGTPAFSVYAASKAAIRSFARNWILELAPRGIRVNVLSPGNTSTPGWHGLASSAEQDQEMQRLTRAVTPLGRLATPDEIANAALFLASAESSYVTGSELFVDGGVAQV
ncbi:MAG: SDR family oxidoreductase [Reyranella sp.]|nr:SDR family oxidoreductase [Reyranella sp.]